MTDLFRNAIKRVKTYQYKKINILLLILVLALTILGINVIGSASIGTGNREKQILGLCIGIVAMVVMIFMDYHFLLKLYWLIYLFNIGLLLLVRVMGKSAGGAMRWINLPGNLALQPSEFAKIFLILFFAKYIMKHHDKLNTFPYLMKCVLLFALPLGLIFLQPDLSTSILITLLFCSIMYAAGINYRIIFSVIGVVAVAAITVVLIIVKSPGEQKILKGYQLKRIIAFYDKNSEFKDDLMYQQENSVIAVGSGGLWGKGLYNDDPNSVKNGNYLFAAHTDFVFAIVGEELGFVGCISVVVLLFLIIIQCFYIGSRAPDVGGRIIACGLGSLIAFQSIINMSVVTMLIPNTGLTLPFVSYGLSSLLSLYIGVGIVLNISMQRKKN